jgi:hypothetical protein
MAISLGKLPVFMRVGDSEEFEIGSLDLDGEILWDGNGGMIVTANPPPLAEFFKAAARSVEEIVADGH